LPPFLHSLAAARCRSSSEIHSDEVQQARTMRVEQAFRPSTASGFAPVRSGATAASPVTRLIDRLAP
jgi:hypothetical protein